MDFRSELERKRKREWLRSMEGLSVQGGFIEETIEEVAIAMFSERTVRAAQKYYKVGQGFCSILEQIERAITEVGNYDTYRLDEEEVPDITSNIDFVEWYIDQSARLASERVLTSQTRFWNDWGLTSGARVDLKKLNILEERILYLREGLDCGTRRTESDIADLSEMMCEEHYIGIILDEVERMLARNLSVRKELDQHFDLCRQAKKIHDNENH